MTIKLTLIKSVIITSVKSETFLRGQVVKAGDDKHIVEAYHEQAGDEQYQEALLARGMRTNLEELKTHLTDYLTIGGQPSARNIYEVCDEEDENCIYILLTVSERFNLSYTSTLARLCSKYIEECMLMDWWKPLNEKLSELYAQYAERDLTAIRRCFNKTAPLPPSYSFADTITLSFPVIDQRATTPAGLPAGAAVPADTLLSYPYIIAVGEETEITYVLSSKSGKKPVDDIIVRADDGCCMPCLDNLGRWQVRGVKPGLSIITLQSRHDDTVFARFALRVT